MREPILSAVNIETLGRGEGDSYIGAVGLGCGAKGALSRSYI